MQLICYVRTCTIVYCSLGRCDVTLDDFFPPDVVASAFFDLLLQHRQKALRQIIATTSFLAAILLSLTCIYVDGVYVMYLQSSHPVAHAQACHFCWTACSIKPCIERIANLFVYMTYYISSFMTSKASCLHACIYWSRWWKFSGFLCVHFCCTSSSPSWGGKR